MVVELMEDQPNLPMLVDILVRCRARFARFERWFDRRFGWFFTNGMKAAMQERAVEEPPEEAVEERLRA